MPNQLIEFKGTKKKSMDTRFGVKYMYKLKLWETVWTLNVTPIPCNYISYVIKIKSHKNCDYDCI